VGGIELNCRPYSAGVLHSVSDQIPNLTNCFTTPNKVTSEDDIEGLVSIKYLLPCVALTGCMYSRQVGGMVPPSPPPGWYISCRYLAGEERILAVCGHPQLEDETPGLTIKGLCHEMVLVFFFGLDLFGLGLSVLNLSEAKDKSSFT
jgi:hypothetical protein